MVANKQWGKQGFELHLFDSLFTLLHEATRCFLVFLSSTAAVWLGTAPLSASNSALKRDEGELISSTFLGFFQLWNFSYSCAYDLKILWSIGAGFYSNRQNFHLFSTRVLFYHRSLSRIQTQVILLSRVEHNKLCQLLQIWHIRWMRKSCIKCLRKGLLCVKEFTMWLGI